MDNGGAFTAQLLADAGIVAGMRVLDVGCGQGDVSLRLASIVGSQGHVTGIDRDGDALAKARERALAQGCGNVAFVAADLGSALPDSAPFDAVVCRRVLMYLPDPQRTLRAIGALLRPGGVVAFQEHDSARIGTEPLPPIHGCLHDRLWRTIASEGGNVHMGLDLAPALRDAGFSIQGVRVEVTMLTPEIENPVAQIGSLMIPRMVAAGVAAEGEFDPLQLERQLAEELAASGTLLSWETICGTWATIA